jgi:hypothetical protein
MGKMGEGIISMQPFDGYKYKENPALLLIGD